MTSHFLCCFPEPGNFYACLQRWTWDRFFLYKHCPELIGLGISAHQEVRCQPFQQKCQDSIGKKRGSVNVLHISPERNVSRD